MTEDGPIELDRGRRLTRRRMAIAGAILTIFKSAVIYWALIFSEHRLEVAQALTAAWPILFGTQAAIVAIVLTYLGVSVTERIMRP